MVLNLSEVNVLLFLDDLLLLLDFDCLVRKLFLLLEHFFFLFELLEQPIAFLLDLLTFFPLSFLFFHPGLDLSSAILLSFLDLLSQTGLSFLFLLLQGKESFFCFFLFSFFCLFLLGFELLD
jgi:hypothetical protein